MKAEVRRKEKDLLTQTCGAARGGVFHDFSYTFAFSFIFSATQTSVSEYVKCCSDLANRPARALAAHLKERLRETAPHLTDAPQQVGLQTALSRAACCASKVTAAPPGTSRCCRRVWTLAALPVRTSLRGGWNPTSIHPWRRIMRVN